jgi:hypothetical protein
VSKQTPLPHSEMSGAVAWAVLPDQRKIATRGGRADPPPTAATHAFLPQQKQQLLCRRAKAQVAEEPSLPLWQTVEERRETRGTHRMKRSRPIGIGHEKIECLLQHHPSAS